MGQETNKLKVQSFIDDVYRVSFLLLIGSAEDANKYLKKSFDKELPNSKGCGGLAVDFDMDGRSLMTVWMPEFTMDAYSISVLMHEINHLVFFVFARIGIMIEAENAEPFTYYAQMIMDKFLKYLAKN